MTSKRKIFFGKNVEELESPLDLIIHTKCPEKWVLVDLETMQIYRGQSKKNSYGNWKRIFKGVR